MRRARLAATLAGALALIAGALAWSAPAGSQTDCSLNEAYTNPDGGSSPIITDTTPHISFTVTNPSLVAFPIDTTKAQFCDANGQDRNPSTGEVRSWQVEAGNPQPALSHQAPPGFFIQGIVVRARLLPTSTTSSSSTSTSTPASTTSTSSTSSSSTSSTSTTSTSTTTTTTVPPGPPGPGIGPVNVRPDPIARTSPDAAAVRGEPRIDVVVGGADGHVYWTFKNGTPWSPYFDLGSPPGGIVGNPSVTSWGPGRIDVFARGSDDKLWQTYSENGGQTWVPWLKTFGDDGVLASGPGVSTRGPDRLNVFVVGTDGNIWERYYDSGWSPFWQSQGAPAAGISTDAAGRDPAPVSWQGADTERVDLFVRGADNKLWQKYWDGSSWSSWLKPVGDEGVLASEPAAMSWEPGNIVIFVRGTDNRAYALPFGTGGWASWVRLVKMSDTWQSGPGATSRGAGSFDLFLRGTDNIVYEIWQ